MIYAMLIFAIVLVVVFWHYLQGLFSAGISAVLSMVAAAIAVGYHETVVQKLLGGKMADYAHAIVLVCLFAAVYFVLRLAFDMLVPGNVRFPVLVEKIGAAAFGLIAGIFVAGVVGIATQTLPFGPSIGYHERFPIDADVAVTVVQNESQQVDAKFDRLRDKGNAFLKGDGSGTFLPAEDWVLGFVKQVSSESGSLSCGKPFEKYHPDYLQELFGQRLVQSGSKRCALEGKTAVLGAYTAGGFPNHYDPEMGSDKGGATGIRAERIQSQGTVAMFKSAKLAEYLPAPGKALLIVRTKFNNDDTDDGTNNMFSFAPGAIRICQGGKNYFPIGTVEYPGNNVVIFYSNRPDDPLFTYGDKAADLVFEVPTSMISGTPPKIAGGAFLEVKRLAHVDLSGMAVLGNERKALADDQAKDIVQVIRKGGLPAKKDEKAPKDPSQIPAMEVNIEGTWQSGDGTARIEFLPTNDWIDNTQAGEKKGRPWTITKKEVNEYTVKLTTPGAGDSNVILQFVGPNQMNYKSLVDQQTRTYNRKI